MALETHIRILLGALTNASIPEAPNPHTICTFEQRFTNACEIDHLLKGGTTFQNRDCSALQCIRNLRARSAMDPTSNIAITVSCVKNRSLHLIFSTIHSFGLPDWCPDLIGGTPTSLYNGALESIALWTLQPHLLIHISRQICVISKTQLSSRSFTEASSGHI